MQRHLLSFNGLFWTFLFCLFVAWGQQVPEHFLSTDGRVNTMHRMGDTMYVGGEFSGMGTRSAYGAALNPATGKPIDNFPATNGVVRAAIADGAGGFFIGGDFTTVGGQSHQHLARIDINGNLYNNFSPMFDASVYALALQGTVLFVGGDFMYVTFNDRPYLAALDTRRGQVLMGFDARPVITSSVRALAVSGDKLFAGGLFKTVGTGGYDDGFTILNSASGRYNYPSGYNRLLLSSNDGYTPPIVYALKIQGSSIHIGGSFFAREPGYATGTTRKGYTSCNINSGKANRVDQVAIRGTVQAIEAINNKVYIGGDISYLGYQTYETRNFLAFDMVGDTAIPDNKFSNVKFNFSVRSIATIDTMLVIGGDFTDACGAIPRSHLAIFHNQNGGMPDARFASGINDYINCIAFSTRNRLYIGGNFGNYILL